MTGIINIPGAAMAILLITHSLIALTAATFEFITGFVSLSNENSGIPRFISICRIIGKLVIFPAATAKNGAHLCQGKIEKALNKKR